MAKREPVDQGVSITWMTIWVMIFVAYFCWGIAASAHLEPVMTPDSEMARIGWLKLMVGGILTFFINSLRIDQCVGVISNVFQNRMGIFWAFVVIETFVVLFGLWLKMVEKELNPPTEKKKKRRKKKRPIRPQVQ